MRNGTLQIVFLFIILFLLGGHANSEDGVNKTQDKPSEVKEASEIPFIDIDKDRNDNKSQTPEICPMVDPGAPYLFSKLQSRAVSQENPTGGKGLGGKDRGSGNCRKGAPAYKFTKPGQTRVLCDIEGPGMIRHIWITMDPEQVKTPEQLRSWIIRMYWDDSPYPSVEVPFGDFFGMALARPCHFVSPYLICTKGRAFNCYFPMPFSKRCKITFENDSDKELIWLFYQVDYTLGDPVQEDWGRFHAHFRRENPTVVGRDFVMLDTKGSPGVFLGACIGVNPIGPGWWGEGEAKFYIDGDTKYPTICGTGTEDYAGNGWGLEVQNSLYMGVNYQTNPNVDQMGPTSFYRFHIKDPIYFQNNLRAELQQLGAGGWSEENKKKYGWSNQHRHNTNTDPPEFMSSWLYDRCDDVSATVYWYQKVMNKPLPLLPSREERIKGTEKKEWEKF